MCSLLGFKGVNDRYGHEVGGRVLRSIAIALCGAVCSLDSVARCDGARFLIILPNTKNRFPSLLSKIGVSLGC